MPLPPARTWPAMSRASSRVVAEGRRPEPDVDPRQRHPVVDGLADAPRRAIGGSDRSPSGGIDGLAGMPPK